MCIRDRLYVEQTKRNHIAMVNGQVETALGGLDYGAGIRLFCGNRVIYAFVNDTSEENLVRTAREMASTVKGTHLLRLPDWKTRQWQNINQMCIRDRSVPAMCPGKKCPAMRCFRNRKLLPP